MRRIFLLFILFSLATTGLLAQPVRDKSELERERQELQQELKEIQGAYNRVKGQSKQALGQLSVLNRKIQLQERYIGNISKEIRMIWMAVIFFYLLKDMQCHLFIRDAV